MLSSSEWPLLLCGPILRRVSRQSVSVFVVLKHPRNVVLSLYEIKEDQPIFLQKTDMTKTLSLGTFFHPGVVTLKLDKKLKEGIIYAYDIELIKTQNGQENSQDNFPNPANLKNLGLINEPAIHSDPEELEAIPLLSLSYQKDMLPTFCYPPTDLEKLSLIHGSCRMPHGQGNDALPIIDDILMETWKDPYKRPHQLICTGDQIYADDVAPTVLFMASQVGRELLAWENPEAIPGIDPNNSTTTKDFELAPERRLPTMWNLGGFTSGAATSHLISFSEYLGMYLVVWSDVFWRAARQGTSTVPIIAEDVFFQYDWGNQWEKEESKRAEDAFKAHHTQVLAFANMIPKVRRALANIPTLMIFDDHEVTDDWNIFWKWISDIDKSLLGKRVIQNALSAYAIFQAWGNDPAAFSEENLGGKLLQAIEKWRGNMDEAINIQENLSQMNWHWSFKDAELSHQILALDTRTKRHFEYKTDPPWSMSEHDRSRGAPGLIDPFHGHLKRQITDAGDSDISLTIIVSPAPIFGFTFVEGFVQPVSIGVLRTWRELSSIWGRKGFSGEAKQDNESWAFHPLVFEELLKALVPFKRVIILSGDVHYGFTASVDYWDQREGTSTRCAKFIQCNASGFKREDALTRSAGANSQDEIKRFFEWTPGAKVVRSKPPDPILSGASKYILLFDIARMASRELLPILSVPLPILTAGYFYLLEKLDHPDVAYFCWKNAGEHLEKGEDAVLVPAQHGMPARIAVPTSKVDRVINPPDWIYRIKFQVDINSRIPPSKQFSEGLEGKRDRAIWFRNNSKFNHAKRVVGHNNLGRISFVMKAQRLHLTHDLFFRLPGHSETNVGLPYTSGLYQAIR